MRISFLIIVSIALSGCAEQKTVTEQAKNYDITKGRFIKRLKEHDLSSFLIKGTPALVFCFGGDKFKAQNILVEEVLFAIDEVSKILPPIINKKLAGTYGAEIGMTAGERYILTRINDFDVRGLTAKKQKACDKFEKDNSLSFDTARKTSSGW